MAQTFSYRRRVEFRDTDMAGIVHFSVFFTYMEEAEHEFLRSIGLQVFAEDDGHQISWPRVAAECNYRNAVKFEDELDVHVSISRIGAKSVTYQHQIFRGDTKIADGCLTVVCCRIEHDQKPESIEIPPHFLVKLKPFLHPSPQDSD